MRAILVSSLLSAAAIAAAAADDPSGWTKARWGMTESDLAQAFGPQFVHWPAPDRFNHSKVGIPSFAIDGIIYKVAFCPDADGLLDSVLLSPVSLADMNEATLQRLESALVQKYGRPYRSDEGGKRKRQWTFKTTVITLELISVPKSRQSLLHLEYARSRDVGL